jgi:hypothetical protein
MYAIKNIGIENRSIHDSCDQSISLAALTYLDQMHAIEKTCHACPMASKLDDSAVSLINNHTKSMIRGTSCSRYVDRSSRSFRNQSRGSS